MAVWLWTRASSRWLRRWVVCKRPTTAACPSLRVCSAFPSNLLGIYLSSFRLGSVSAELESDKTLLGTTMRIRYAPESLSRFRSLTVGIKARELIVGLPPPAHVRPSRTTRAPYLSRRRSDLTSVSLTPRDLCYSHRVSSDPGAPGIVWACLEAHISEPSR